MFSSNNVNAQIVPEPTWSSSEKGIVPCGQGDNKDNACTLCHLVIGFQRIVQYLLWFVTTIAFVGIFFAGAMYILSTGDEGMITSAKNFLKASLIGFALVLGAWIIVNTVLWVIGTKGSTPTGSTASSSTSSANNPGSGVLGINAISWNNFKCDAKSTTGGTNNNTDEKKAAGSSCGTKDYPGVCTKGTSCNGKRWVMQGTSCDSGYLCCGAN
ncbi:MAG: pilin [Candidatus Moranbacteria bacterium]|nr:pilin [Candidatus Moranbacteria bacterium]